MDEFSMVYDDWMVFEKINIEKTYVAKEIALLAQIKYPRDMSVEFDEKFDYLYDKSLATHQKLAMMMYAQSMLLKVRSDFESTQNMTLPALYGQGKTKILFYFESMIVFARNALDVAASAYSDLLYKRTDSFNKFVKWVKNCGDSELEELKQFYSSCEENQMSALRLLCGQEKGRALRDIIIHQANVRMEYHKYKENSEREHLFLEIANKEPIDIDYFVSHFTQEVIEILEMTNVCCKKKLLSNK